MLVQERIEMNNETKQVTFTIPAPPKEHHARLRLKAAEIGWIKLHNGDKPGHIVPPEAGGLEYDYTLSPDGNHFVATITKNPFNVSAEELRLHIEEGFAKLLA